jgi:hypothetical protein
VFAGGTGSGGAVGCPLSESTIGANMMFVSAVNSVDILALAPLGRSSCSSVIGNALGGAARGTRGLLSAAPNESIVRPETKERTEGTRSPYG